MGQFKTLLSEKLSETNGRDMFTATEVRDAYLDLWLALEADETLRALEPIGV